jgi:membrane protein implicated in regulation of membrane protease activity
MIDTPITLVFWHWRIASVVLLGLEMVIPGAFFLWMGAAAGVTGAMLLIFPDPSWQTQFLIFAVLSVVAIVGWRAWRKKHPPVATDHPPLNQRTKQYVGRVITLDQALENRC